MNIFTKLTYGLYLVTARGDGRDNGCIINTAVQQTSNPETVAVTLNKSNLTTEMISKTGVMNLNVLSVETPFEIFSGFGMRSGRDVDKFDRVETFRTENGCLGIRKYSVGYLNLKVKQSRDLGTHIWFLGEATASEVFGGEPVSYAYYHANIKPKPQKTSSKDEYVCTVCGFVREGKPDDDYVCPVCKHGAEVFEKVSVNNNITAEAVKIIDKKGDQKMAKFVCSVCGYVYEGDEAPAQCPVCKAPREKFVKQEGEMSWASEHVIGVASGAPEDIIKDLRMNFEGECTEVGMYLAMARAAHREGYPEVGMYYEKAAWEEAEHASKFAELLGEVVSASTKKNLEMRIEAENGATAGKTDLAKRAKALNLDAIHDTVHEMARDEARHGKAFLGLYNRYFKK